jgi:hypothetical protein
MGQTGGERVGLARGEDKERATHSRMGLRAGRRRDGQCKPTRLGKDSKPLWGFHPGRQTRHEHSFLGELPRTALLLAGCWEE